MTERFDLQGTTYYQQGRKCSKPTCQCAGGELHGPYWYSRTDGRVKHIGKKLPKNVTEAKDIFDGRLIMMAQERHSLLRQAEILGRLIKRQALQPGDRDALVVMGYKDCLV